MPRRPGPDPKSKRSLFLGDEDVSDEESFRSVERQTDDTDYGFDYTNVGVERPTPRRSNKDNPSTSRQATANRNGSKSIPSSPVTRGTTQQQKKQSKEGGKQQTSQKPGTSTKQKFLSAPNKSPSSRRKQTNPLRRDKMWKQINDLQRRTDDLTPKAPFGRLIRELLIQEFSEADRITKTALECLQASAELYLTHLFSDAYVCTLHRGRVTLGINDLRLVRFLRGSNDADVGAFKSI